MTTEFNLASQAEVGKRRIDLRDIFSDAQDQMTVTQELRTRLQGGEYARLIQAQPQDEFYRSHKRHIIEEETKGPRIDFASAVLPGLIYRPEAGGNLDNANMVVFNALYQVRNRIGLEYPTVKPNMTPEESEALMSQYDVIINRIMDISARPMLSMIPGVQVPLNADAQWYRDEFISQYVNNPDMPTEAYGNLVGEIMENVLKRQEEEEKARLQTELTATRDTQTNLLRDASEAKELAARETDRANRAEQRASEAETRLQEAQRTLESISGELELLQQTTEIQLAQIEGYTLSEEQLREVLNNIMAQMSDKIATLSAADMQANPLASQMKNTLEGYMRRMEMVIAGLNTNAEKELVEKALKNANDMFSNYFSSPKQRAEYRPLLIEAQQNYYHMLWHEQSQEIFKDIALLKQSGVPIDYRALYNGYDKSNLKDNDYNLNNLPAALLMKVYPLTQREDGPFAKPLYKQAAINLYTKLRNIVEKVSDCYVLDDRLVSYSNLAVANHDVELQSPQFKARLVNNIPILRALTYDPSQSYPEGHESDFRISAVEKVGVMRKTIFSKDQSVQAVNAIVEYVHV